ARIEVGDPDASDWDVALCIAVNLLVGRVARELMPLVAIQLGILAFKDKPTIPDQFLRLSLPFHIGHVPNTESVVDAPVLAVAQDPRSITLLGDLQLTDDVDGHYFYFRVPSAIAGDQVVVMDQDTPAPPGDDALVVGQPARGTVVSTAHDTRS